MGSFQRQSQMLKERIVMIKKFVFIFLGLSLALFSGCVSPNKYKAMETELNNTQTQMKAEKKSIADLRIQNEKLNNENIRLSESIEYLKLELEKEKLATDPIEGTNPESDSYADEKHLPYSILLSSCQKRESVEKVLSEYKESDLVPYVVKVDLGEKGSWWRIFMGHYETREGAIIEMNKFGFADKIVLKASNAESNNDSKGEDEASNKMSFLMKYEVDPYFEGY